MMLMQAQSLAADFVPEHPGAALHASTVAELAGDVAAELGLGPRDRHATQLAGLVHDIGKVAIPAEIIEKPGPLTSEEREVIETHTVRGQELLERADPSLQSVASVVRSCHERYDGAGYPDGLAGDDIPLPARVVFCCDAYDAMTTDRPYRRALGHERALSELRDCAGKQFDRRVVRALSRVLSRRQQAAAGSRAPATLRQVAQAG